MYRRAAAARGREVLKRCGALAVIAVLWSGTLMGRATITAASCGRDDVNTALGLASAGDTIRIPAGTCSWTSGISWTAPAGVSVIGAGTSAVGGGDVTVIVDDYNSSSPLWAITINASGTFRLSGLTIQQHDIDPVKENGSLGLTGPGSVRLDHMHFDTHTTPGNTKPIWIGDRVFGVIDHSILDLYSNAAPYIANGAGADGQGNATWAAATGFGGADFIFFEDNVYRATVAAPCRIGDVFTAGRTVWRFNTIQGCSGLENHATGHASDDRGARASEGYGNLLTVLADQVNPPFDLAEVGNGAYLLWGNVSEDDNVKNVFFFNVTRKNNTTYTQLATPDGWGYCGTEFNGTGSNWDGNSDAATGYPCVDQPGRGQGDLVVGSFSTKTNNTTGKISTLNQALEPIYFWNNIGVPNPAYSGGSTDKYNLDNTAGRVLAGRDFYKSASGVQTSSSSPFDGTTTDAVTPGTNYGGVGFGTLANRPATCTAGVGYFATDQGSWNTSTSNPQGVQQNGADGLLYTCTSTDTWTLYYTPYTYPHPLQGSASSGPVRLRLSGVN
jgi:hypothetical protein